MSMNKYRKLFWWIIDGACISLICICFSSCKKFVQVSLPPNEIVSASVFADSADATSAILGIYILCMENGQMTIGNGGLSLYSGLSGDELIPTSSTNQNYYQFYKNSLLSSNLLNESDMWSIGYQLIYQANACLEGVESSTTLTNTLKSQLMAEAKFIRAFFYFNLVNLYGEVPLSISSNYNVNAIMGRSSVDSVYDQIFNDLSSALKLFPTQITLGSSRPNYLSTEALLAKAYLYKSQWANAISASTEVINSGLYQLDTLNGIFLEGSTEAIWQLVPVLADYSTDEGLFYLPSSNNVKPGYIISSFLLNAFEQGDLRRINWLDSNIVNGTIYYYPYKYKLPYDLGNVPNEAFTILRLSEQYLIRAEAEAQTDDISDAVGDLNIIRVRAGLPDYSGGMDKISVLTAIYHERQVELFCECGNRWFDLKRTNTLNQVMGGSNGVCASKGGTWVLSADVYPIPLSQILANSSLIQNNGY